MVINYVRNIYLTVVAAISLSIGDDIYHGLQLA